MNWKAATVAALCFGAGLMTGFIIFQKAPAHQQLALAPHAILSTKSPSIQGAVVPGTGNEVTGTPAAALQTKHPSTVADLEVAIRSSRSRWDLSNIFRALDGLDINQFGEAIAASLKSTDLISAAYAIRELSTRWGRTDPHRALAFAQALGNSSQRVSVIAGIVAGWAENDPAAATAYAKQLPAGQVRNQALSAVASTIASQDPQAAITLMNSLPPGYSHPNLFWPLFGKWTTSSPSDAAAAALQLSPNDRDQAVGIIANIWAIQDFEAAFAWARGLPPGNTRNQAIKRVFLVAYDDKELQAAAAWVVQQPADPNLNEVVSGVADAMAQSDAAAAAAWIRSLPEGPLKRAALEGSFRSLAYNDPQGTADLLASLPADQERDSMYQRLASTWASIDLSGASKWVDSLPTGNSHDQATQSVAQRMAQVDPTAAARLVDTIQDENIWRGAAQQVATEWLRLDPNAAKQWVAQSKLPEEFKSNFGNQKR